MHFISRTHRGNVAKNNEDRLLIRKLDDDFYTLLIADGLGGQPGGDVAASLVANYIGEQPVQRFTDKLEPLLIESSELIIRHGADHPSIDGMGSTATFVVVSKTDIHWAHVGDCRLYQLSGGVLQCKTKDQTIARQAYDRGEISFSEIHGHPHNHVLEQCLGEDDIEPACGEFNWSHNDILLMSSDGLHNMIDDGQIHAILNANSSLDEKADLLLDMALKAGGKDNISFIVGCHAMHTHL